MTVLKRLEKIVGKAVIDQIEEGDPVLHRFLSEHEAADAPEHKSLAEKVRANALAIQDIRNRKHDSPEERLRSVDELSRLMEIRDSLQRQLRVADMKPLKGWAATIIKDVRGDVPGYEYRSSVLTRSGFQAYRAVVCRSTAASWATHYFLGESCHLVGGTYATPENAASACLSEVMSHSYNGND